MPLAPPVIATVWSWNVMTAPLQSRPTHAEEAVEREQDAPRVLPRLREGPRATPRASWRDLRRVVPRGARAPRLPPLTRHALPTPPRARGLGIPGPRGPRRRRESA